MKLEHTIPSLQVSDPDTLDDSSDFIAAKTERHTPDQAVLDRKMQEAAQQLLNATGYQILNRAEVHVDGGAVRLSGLVRRYYHKAVATTAILKLDGVTDLKNELQVSAR
ncbi:MAG: BON domain-containing protein [Rhodopirellula sp.]|nr:BON domain-containing protein [Rhodopirellula sp.]